MRTLMEAGRGAEGLYRGGVVLVRALGPDRLSGHERDTQTGARYVDGLTKPADEMHFDTSGGRVPARLMGKGLQLEVRTELGVHPLKQVSDWAESSLKRRNTIRRSKKARQRMRSIHKTES